jgi:hypothetical protein
LVKKQAPTKLICSLSISIAKNSQNHPRQDSFLIEIHNLIGKVGGCYLEGGKFLELLLEVLLRQPSQYNKDLSRAFSCLFSNIPLLPKAHHSNLELKCSKFIQPFINHVHYLHLKNELSSSILFTVYLEIWLHSKKGCNCIQHFNGLLMYKILKKKVNSISKAQLPNNYDPEYVLQELIMNIDDQTSDSQIIRAKRLIKLFYTKTSSIEESEKNLVECLSILENETSPKSLLFFGIVIALLDKNPEQSLEILQSLPPFQEAKQESRRIYWILPLLYKT